MTSVANHKDEVYWDYSDERQFIISVGIMPHQLKDIPTIFWKVWIEDFLDLSNNCKSICFPQQCSSLRVVETNVAFEKSETVFLHYCTKNKMTVIWEQYISPMKIYSKYFSEVNQSKQRINFNSVCFYDPCVSAWFIEVITSLETWYSCIYPSICAVNNFVLDIIIKV